MLTIHAADAVRVTWESEPLVDGAVAVRADRVAAVGTLGELRQEWPGARVRVWPGVLGPGHVHLGELPDAPSARERVHGVLQRGAVAVLDESVRTEGVRGAAGRSGVRVLSQPRALSIVVGGRADLAVFDGDGQCLATVCVGRLVYRRR